MDPNVSPYLQIPLRSIQEVMRERDIKRGARFNEPEGYEPQHMEIGPNDVANYET